MFFDFEYLIIFFDKSIWSPTLNKKPYLPLSNISFGPVGQLDEIINFFKLKASSSTFGRPSYFDDKIKISDYGFNILQIESTAACNMACSFCPYPLKEDKISKIELET